MICSIAAAHFRGEQPFPDVQHAQSTRHIVTPQACHPRGPFYPANLAENPSITNSKSEASTCTPSIFSKSLLTALRSGLPLIPKAKPENLFGLLSKYRLMQLGYNSYTSQCKASQILPHNHFHPNIRRKIRTLIPSYPKEPRISWCYASAKLPPCQSNPPMFTHRSFRASAFMRCHLTESSTANSYPA